MPNVGFVRFAFFGILILVVGGERNRMMIEERGNE